MKIRHEINIITLLRTLDGGAGGVSQDLPESVIFDKNLYSGTIEVYFEIVATRSAAGSVSQALRVGTTNIITVTSGAGGGTYERSRSVNITGSNLDTLSSGDCFVRMSASAGTTTTIKSARIIIIQDTGSNPLTASESQFEIGSYHNAATNTTAAALTNPKYWKYEASKWDGALQFFVEATYLETNNMYTVTIVLQESDGTGDGFVGWTDKETILAAGTATVATRVRSAAFTPTDGRNYRLVSYLSNNMGTYTVYNGKIIVRQNIVGVLTESLTDSTFNIFDGAGQSFTLSESATVNAVEVKVSFAIGGVVAEILSGGINGTVLGTSDNYTSDIGAIWDRILFSTPVNLSAGQYFLRFLPISPATSVTIRYGNSNPYAGGSFFTLSGSTWTEQTTQDLTFRLLSISDGITKLQDQYLLANTLFAAGTANQNFLTKFDPAEWDGVTNEYLHAVDASDNNTSVVDLRDASSNQLSGSVVTTPDNQEFSNEITGVENTTSVGSTSLGTTYIQLIQAFQQVSTATLFKIKLSGSYITNSPSGTMVIKIYAHTGTYGSSSRPSGSALATSEPFNASSLEGTAKNIFFEFSGINQITLSSSTYYILSVEFDSENAYNSYIRMGNGYSGDAYNWNGSSWTSIQDLFFSIIHTPGSITMPSTAQNIDVRATTNSGNIYASRIIANILKYTPPPASRRAITRARIIY